MREIWESLTNREVALLLWLLVGVTFAIAKARSSWVDLAKAFFAPKVIGIFLALGSYVTLLTLALSTVQFWETSLLKDTILWFSTVACVALFSAVRVGEKPGVFRDMVLDSLKFTVLVEFVLDTFVLPLGWELVLIPVLFCLGAMSGIAESRKEHKSIRKPLQGLMNLVTLALLAYAFYQLFRGLAGIATIDTIKEIALAPILTILSIPFFFLFALWVHYESHFIRLEVWLKDQPHLIREAKWRSFAECGLSLRRLGKLRGDFYVSIQEASDAQDISSVIHAAANKPEPRLFPGEVVQTRIVPYTLPLNGVLVQKVLIDWRNKSDTPVGAAFAEIIPYDADGDKLESGASEYCIFCAENESEKIVPGGTYVQSEDRGFILLSNVFGVASRVEVKITKLLKD